jgi:hypothetical protein
MNLTVMRPAQRHRELIAYLATERTGLRKTQMMRIRWTSTANQAGLFDDMPDMVAVTNPAWLRKYQDTLVNLWRFLGQALIIDLGSNVVGFCVIWRNHCKFNGERFLLQRLPVFAEYDRVGAYFEAPKFAIKAGDPFSTLRSFGIVQWQRRIVVRWEYHTQNFLSFQLACLLILFRRF